jgi:hypothetical protein
MANIAVVYQSERGHTKRLAEAVLRGIVSTPGVSCDAIQIASSHIHSGRFKDESLMNTLDRADGIVFGCATYMGSCSAVDGRPLSERITRCLGRLLAAEALGAYPQLSQISEAVFVCTRYQVFLPTFYAQPVLSCW